MTDTAAPSRERALARRGWARFALSTLARMYLVFTATLVAIAVVPAAFGWHGTVVQTGSMSPLISPGDLVVVSPLGDDDPVPVGGVVQFRSPASAEPDGKARYRLHRIVAGAEEDGEYITAGDANADVDSTPITRDQIVGQGRILVRFVGLPQMWMQRGDFLPLALWGAGTAMALYVVLAPPRRRRSRRGAVVAGIAASLLTAVGVPAIPAVPADAAFTARTNMVGNTWQVAKGIDDRGYGNYRSVISRDAPWAYYPLDEVRTSFTASDRSGHGRNASYSWFGASETTGPLTRETNRAITLNGTSAATFATPTQVAAPKEFAIELWIRTGSGAGGEIASFGSSRTGVSGTTSRKLYMGSDGRLRFGGSPAAVVTSDRSYNDSAWHHVVATLGSTGTALYVDGARVAANTSAASPTMTGYWRLGGDTVRNWPSQPTATYFSGSLDEVAVYDVGAPLSAERVRAHFEAASANTSSNYPDEVAADSPSYYYHLDEGRAGAILDFAGSRRDSAYPSAGVTYGVEGVLPKRNNRAATFNGSAGSLVTQTTQTNPQVFTVETWFNTTTTRGGQLIGFGNSSGTSSTRHDRKVYMTNSGQLIFGVYPGTVKTVVTPRAYNDGAWHHVAATLSDQGMRLYVDGALVGSDASVRSTEAYTGYWRMAEGNLTGWPSPPSSGHFAGALDEVAIYSTALTDARVYAHYKAR